MCSVMQRGTVPAMYQKPAGTRLGSRAAIWPFLHDKPGSQMPTVDVLLRLEDERELLAPAVAHWQQVQQLEAAVSTARLQLLQEQQEHGSKLIKLQGQQASCTHTA